MILSLEKNTSQNAIVAYLVAVAFCVFTIIGLWPYLQYYIDPDATSYLTIVSRYLKGDFTGAVNAFWSPLGIWLTTLWVKCTNMPLFQSAIIVNSLASVSVVVLAQRLFNKYVLGKWDRVVFAAVSGVLWAIFTYKQSFTDIWQYAFILLGMSLMMRKVFYSSIVEWIIVGAIGALAYFGKAYAFYFYPLMVIAILMIQVFVYKFITIQKAIQIGITIVAMQLLVAAPWIYVLYQKYGFLTFSTAGKLNMSWWLEGRKIYTDDIKGLLPPIDKDGVFFFEDSYSIQAEHPRFYTSITYAIKQFVRIVYNGLQWMGCASLMSPFYFVLWCYTIGIIVTRKWKQLPAYILIMMAVFLLYPLPFWLITLDGGRYLWVTIPLAMTVGWWLLLPILSRYTNKIVLKIAVVVIMGSFLVNHVLDLKEMWNLGKSDYETAQILKEKGITNQSFYTNQVFMSEFGHSILRTAYFAHNQYFSHEESSFDAATLKADAERYGVKYYFYYYNDASDTYVFLNDDGSVQYDILDGAVPGLKVFKLP